MTHDLPPRGMLGFSVPVLRRNRRLTIDGDLSDWSDRYRLPDLGALDGRPGFGEVYMAWDEQGLYFALAVSGKKGVSGAPKRPHKGDALFLWIDTRDVRDAMRAGRFCHHFLAIPRPLMAWQAPVPRAREQAPVCKPSELVVASRVGREGYELELALPAAVLSGYDPAECSRLGLTFQVTDGTRTQLWNVPPNLPFQHDPSTWAVAELVK
jgi:hypothetical protein